MQGHPDWRSAIAITCSFAIVLVVVAWGVRKSASARQKQPKRIEAEKPEPVEETLKSVDCEESAKNEADDEESLREDSILELPDPKWVKVGQVQELYVYPLKSGRGRTIKECDFTEFGISLEDKGRITLKDRMFLVYNEETGRFQTGRQYPTLILVSLSAVDETKVKLEAVGMSSVIFEVPQGADDTPEAVQCTMWWGEPVKCIDCGPEPAEWLSRFLTGTTSGLRLGCTMMNKRDLQVAWKKHTEVYKNLRNEDSGLFSDLASYMLMTTRSVEQLNEKLERPVPALQFRPNILVSTQRPFEEDNWEWIKIGERAVIRNVKPCTRFRYQIEPDRVSLEGNAPAIGIYCGLYIPGKVKLGDEVYIHSSNDSSVEVNNREATS